MNNLNSNNDFIQRVNSCIGISESLLKTFKDKQFSKLENKIHELAQQDFSKFNFNEYKDVKKKLSLLKKNLDSIQESPSSVRLKDKDIVIEGLSRDLLQISQKLDILKEDEKPIPQRDKVDVTVAILSDFDVPDTSGEVSRDAIHFLKGDTPFIASGSIVSGASMKSAAQRVDHLNTISELLSQNKWEIFELQGAAGEKSGLFAFLPKKGESGNNLLKEYGLAEGLKKTTASRVLEGGQKKPDPKCLGGIFSAEKNKIFYFVGHGWKGTAIGGILKNKFPEVLGYLKAGGCKGLLMDSCFEGGGNSEIFSNPLGPVKFPVVLSSTGDFLVFSHRSTLQSRLNTLKEVVENPIATPTAEGYRKTYQSFQVQSELKDYDNQSLLQIYFPGAEDAPTGFRSVGEGGHLYPVTNIIAKKAEISKQTIKVEGKILGLRPTIINPKVSFASGVTLHSMVPGNASHVLKELSDVRSVSELIKSTLSFNNAGKADKAFCISELTSESGQTLQEVIILCTSSNPVCVFKREGKYYSTTNDSSEKEISPFHHAMICRRAINLGPNVKEGLKYPFSGVSGREEVLNSIINSNVFYQGGSPAQEAVKKWLPLIDAIEHEEANVSFDQAKPIFEDKDISNSDKEHILCLICQNKPQLGLELVERLDPSFSRAKNWNGRSLLSLAAYLGNLSLIEKLIEKGADCFAIDSHNLNPLDYAMEKGYWQIAEKILSQPHQTSLKPNLSLFKFINQICNTEEKKEDLQLGKGVLDKILLQTDKEAFFHQVSGDSPRKTNLLGVAALSQDDKTVSFLLASGADPNSGDCLSLAVNGGKESIVEELLKNGANPLKKDSQGHIPIIEAAAKGSVRMLDLMISAAAKEQLKASTSHEAAAESEEKAIMASFLSHLADNDNLTAFTAALMSRDRDKIQLLLNKGAELPKYSFSVFENVVHGLISTNDVELLEKLKNVLSNYRVVGFSNSNKTFLIQNGYFDIRLLDQTKLTSEQLLSLVKTFIDMEDVNNLNQIKTQLTNLDIQDLYKFEKRFLIENGVIDPEEFGIDPKDLEEDELEGKVDSDTEE